jgi:hypothetical protein
MVEETTATAANAAAAPAGKYDQLVSQWVAANFVNSAISRNTECWNVLQKALDDLKVRLDKAG